MSHILRLHQRVVVKQGTYSHGGEREEGVGNEGWGTFSKEGQGEGLGMLGTLLGIRHLRLVQEL